MGITFVLENQQSLRWDLINTEWVGILMHVAFASYKLDLACPKLLSPFPRQGINLLKALGRPARSVVR